MKGIVHEIQIFGPITTYARYVHTDTIILESHENYQKRSFRNRYHILGPNGIINMTIPLEKGKNYRTPIKNVKISYNENWMSNHIHTIQTCYGSAPYFMYYSDIIFDMLKSRESNLYVLCFKALKLMLEMLMIDLDVRETVSFQRNITDNFDWRNGESIANSQAVELTYNQVFEEKFGFTDGLSILDLLFCLGPESAIWLKKLSIIPHD